MLSPGPPADRKKPNSLTLQFCRQVPSHLSFPVQPLEDYKHQGDQEVQEALLLEAAQASRKNWKTYKTSAETGTRGV